MQTTRPLEFSKFQLLSILKCSMGHGDFEISCGAQHLENPKFSRQEFSESLQKNRPYGIPHLILDISLGYNLTFYVIFGFGYNI